MTFPGYVIEKDATALRTKAWKDISFLEYEERGSSGVDTLYGVHSNILICLPESSPVQFQRRIST